VSNTSSSSGSTSRIERFGPYLFDLGRATLYRGNEPVILARKRFEVLQLLAEHAGTIVRKEEIIDRVWPNQLIDENNLSLQIFNLRRDLEDDPKKPTYILTAPGIGYLLRTDKVIPPTPAETGESTSNPSESNAPQLPGGVWFRSRLLVGVIAAFCLGIGLLIGYIGWNANRPAVAKISSFTSMPGLEGEPAFSPDGSMLVFSSEGEGGSNRDLYLKRRDGEEPIRLTTHPEIDTQPAWSPDGRQIAFLRRNQANWAMTMLVVLTYPGGSNSIVDEKEIAAAGEGLDWSPDGKYFVTGVVSEMDAKTDSGRGLCLISVDGSEKRVITSPLAGEVPLDFNPRFSPDGRWIAFQRSRDQETSLSDLYVLDLEKEGSADATTQLTFDRRRISDLRWMPDGRSLIIASYRDDQHRLWQIPINNGKPAGEPRIVTSIAAKVENFDLTRNGEVLAFTEQLEDTTIEIRRLGGPADGYPCLINSSSTEDSPRFSPDGERLVFCSGRTGRDELWTARSDCTGLAMLHTFEEPGGTGSPRWSPDGETIAFDGRAGQGDGNLINVFTLHLPGISNGAKPQGLGIDDHSNFMPAWSHDGRQIYFQSSRNGEPQIWRQELASGRQFQVTTVGGDEAIESADGETLFFARKGYLWRRDQKDEVEKPIAELENFPVRRYWCVVGRGIYFVPRTSDIRPVVYRFDLQTHRIEKVMEVGGFPARTVPGLSVTPDEKLLAISYISYSMGDIKLAGGWVKF